MKLNLCCLFFCLLQFMNIGAQVTLEANDGANTYELITSVLAPGGNPVETPDCSHPDFGNHIDMVFDAELNSFVFRFHIHKTPDNDRCINFGRQRNEIKTYSGSPENLLGVSGEMVEYKWKFKIDANFQSSSGFTHLHQLKAVGGPEADMPLITLTARKGNPDKLELRYAEHLNQETLYQADLSPFKGNWVQVAETVTYGEKGTYTVMITKVEDGSILFDYNNNLVRTWKTDAEFIRPKWGIYRSLANPDDLRDEEVYFADFSICEFNTTSAPHQAEREDQLIIYPNPTDNRFQLIYKGIDLLEKMIITDIDGKVMIQKKYIHPDEVIDMSSFKNGIYLVSYQMGKYRINKKVVKK